MARAFITGSSDGLGRNAAKLLVALGHKVVLHARSEEQARDAAAAVPGADRVLVGDFASLGAWDGRANGTAVHHDATARGNEQAKNKGIYTGGKRRLDRDRIKSPYAAALEPAAIARDVGCSRMQVNSVFQAGE